MWPRSPADVSATGSAPGQSNAQTQLAGGGGAGRGGGGTFYVIDSEWGIAL